MDQKEKYFSAFLDPRKDALLKKKSLLQQMTSITIDNEFQILGIVEDKLISVFKYEFKLTILAFLQLILMPQQAKQEESNSKEGPYLDSSSEDTLGLQSPDLSSPSSPVMPAAPVLRPRPIPDDAEVLHDGFMLEDESETACQDSDIPEKMSRNSSEY